MKIQNFFSSSLPRATVKGWKISETGKRGWDDCCKVWAISRISRRICWDLNVACWSFWKETEHGRWGRGAVGIADFQRGRRSWAVGKSGPAGKGKLGWRNIEWKDLWSKEMFEIRSILQGLIGKIATAMPQNKVSIYENRDLSPTPPMCHHKYASINFGRFYGDNPEAWIFQAEHYFEFYEIAEKYKLSLASLYLDGEALEWYQWLFRNKQLSDWKHFTTKVFDDLSERPTDANSINIYCKLSQLEVKDPHKVCKLTIGDTTEAIFPYDLAYSISPTAAATDYENDVKSEDRNDEEEIVTIRNGKVYPQHGLRLAQCWKTMSSIPSTCSYPNLITRGITSRLGHDVILLILNLFPPDQFGLEFPFDPGSSLLTMYNLSPNIPVNRVVKLLCAIFGLIHKSRTVSRHIHFNSGQFLDCGDSVLNHFVVSLWVQTFQLRLPRPLPKPPFSISLLNFLAQIEKSVEIESKFDFDGLVIIERVDLVMLHILLYDLIAMERHGKEGAYKIVRRYLKVDNFIFDGLEYVKKYHLHHISIDRKGIDVENKWSEDIAEFVSYINEYLLVNKLLVPCVAASNISKIKIMIYGSLNDIIRWFTLLDTSQTIIHLCHAILYKVRKVQKLSKSDGVNSAILKASNKIIIMVFTCSSQGNYNTPSC
ncbi:hypothetical protein MTR67_044546 [Solanum verrucosum]|uniref:Uncharacterized protein n=1 Tax=Solanum verrucosum TaxID=315347 RepID=A0AAF0UU54_SOLVR|nr:hypothetical protein MTR67_044546 [Solanum verrucosum]